MRIVLNTNVIKIERERKEMTPDASANFIKGIIPKYFIYDRIDFRCESYARHIKNQ